MQQKRRTMLSSLTLAVLVSISSLSLGQQTHDITSLKSRQDNNGVTAEQILCGPDENWLTYAGGYDSRRYSSLDQINRQNIKSLTLGWSYHISGSTNLRTTPLVHDGVMYVTNVNEVYALNATTGKKLWAWLENGRSNVGFNRGVALLGDKVYFVTEACELVALNSKTGRLIWRKKYADPKNKGYYATLAPLAISNRIIVGVSADHGVRGFVVALSADDGRELWRFWTVPSRGEPEAKTWGQGANLDRGGAGTWLTGSYDAELDTVYWPTGNPWPNFDSNTRPGDNLYSQCMLALDGETGKLKWYFQFTPADTHGWDATESPVLVNMKWKGQSRRLLLQANRNGFFYVLDRATGEFLLGKPFVKKLTWATGLDVKGRPLLVPGMTYTEIIDRASTNTASKYPDAKILSEHCPWLRGATNWWSASYSEQTNLFYVTALEQCGGEKGEFVTRAIDPRTGDSRWEYQMSGSGVMAAGVLSTAGGLLFAGEDGGSLIALDAVSGKRLWKSELKQAIFASPMSYAIGGRQYVAIAAGSDVFSFRLSRN